MEGNPFCERLKMESNVSPSRDLLKYPIDMGIL